MKGEIRRIRDKTNSTHSAQSSIKNNSPHNNSKKFKEKC